MARSWRTRPGEPVRLVHGVELVGKGTYKGRPQAIYHNPMVGRYYRVTQEFSGGWLVEEFSEQELDLGCVPCNE